MAKWLSAFLGLELLVVVGVTLAFRWIESRFQAGMVAGSFFIMLGVAIFVAGLTDRIRKRSLTFALGCVHLFGVALPMVIVRLLNSEIDFGQIRIWGLSGPVFHKVSTGIYLALIVATLYEGIGALRSVRREARS